VPSNHVIPSPEQLKKYAYCKWHNFYSHTTNDYNIFCRQVQSAINEGRLRFAESPQMKLDKGSFPANMNTVELNGGKVLVRHSSQVNQGQRGCHRRREATEDDQAPKSNLEIGRWKKNEKSKPRSHPKDTFSSKSHI
jgi:hypothetical protein